MFDLSYPERTFEQIDAQSFGEQSSDGEFFDCENNTGEIDLNQAKKVNVKVVAKTVLQTFKPPTTTESTAKSSTNSLPYSVLTKEALALASCVTPNMITDEVQLRAKSGSGLTIAEKSKLRKSASDIDSKSKSSPLFSSHSFRRVLHPFTSSKHPSRTPIPHLAVKKSSSTLEGAEKDKNSKK